MMWVLESLAGTLMPTAVGGSPSGPTGLGRHEETFIARGLHGSEPWPFLPKFVPPSQIHQPVQDLCEAGGVGLWLSLMLVCELQNCRLNPAFAMSVLVGIFLGSFLHVDSDRSRTQLKSCYPAPPCVSKTKIMIFKTSLLLMVTHHVS